MFLKSVGDSFVALSGCVFVYRGSFRVLFVLDGTIAFVVDPWVRRLFVVDDVSWDVACGSVQDGVGKIPGCRVYVSVKECVPVGVVKFLVECLPVCFVEVPNFAFVEDFT